MLSRLDARLRRLEQQVRGTDTALAQGLSGLLAYARTHHSEAVPITDLTDIELDAKITALAGTCGLSFLLRQALEEERTRRQGAQARHPQHEPHPRPSVDLAGTAGPCSGDVLHSQFRPVVTKVPL
jgi:hypothetical protein